MKTALAILLWFIMCLSFAILDSIADKIIGEDKVSQQRVLQLENACEVFNGEILNLRALLKDTVEELDELKSKSTKV